MPFSSRVPWNIESESEREDRNEESRVKKDGQ
jgi:hypothetical protein